MPDHFAILQQPRRPWLEAEALKDCFHRKTAEHHPDVAGTGAGEGDFAAVNAAYCILRDPASRLRHLLELESPETLVSARQIPPPVADLFVRIAGFRRSLDVFRQKEGMASGALARALMAEERLVLTEQGEAVRTELEDGYDSALAEIRGVDAGWQQPPRPHGVWESLAALQLRCAYLVKWRSQIAESLFQFHAPSP